MVSLNFGCIFLRLVIRFLILTVLHYSPSHDNFVYKIMSQRISLLGSQKFCLTQSRMNGCMDVMSWVYVSSTYYVHDWNVVSQMIDSHGS